MLPVTEKNIIKIDLNKEYLSKKEILYNKLLKEQIFWLNRHRLQIYGHSKNLYDKYLNNTLSANILKRCCNFKLLEKNVMNIINN